MAKKRDLYDFITSLEKGLFSLIVLSFTTMAVAQVLLTDESWRNYLNFASRLESQKIQINNWQPQEMAVSAEVKDIGYVTLRLEKFNSLPHAYILVNGREVKKFASQIVSVPVRRGDIVEVDGTYYEKPFDITIVNTTENLTSPEKNSAYKINHDIVALNEVIFSE